MWAEARAVGNAPALSTGRAGGPPGAPSTCPQPFPLPGTALLPSRRHSARDESLSRLHSSYFEVLCPPAGMRAYDAGDEQQHDG